METKKKTPKKKEISSDISVKEASALNASVRKGHPSVEIMKISVQTIIRTIILFIALLNQVLTLLGKNPLPFAEEEIYELITALATVAAAMWSWWKNNSFSSIAIMADEYLNELRNRKTDE